MNDVERSSDAPEDTLPPSPVDVVAASERVSPCCGAETIFACCFCGHDLETNPIIYCSVCCEYKIVPDLICSQCEQLIELG